MPNYPPNLLDIIPAMEKRIRRLERGVDSGSTRLAAYVREISGDVGAQTAELTAAQVKLDYDSNRLYSVRAHQLIGVSVAGSTVQVNLRIDEAGGDVTTTDPVRSITRVSPQGTNAAAIGADLFDFIDPGTYPDGVITIGTTLLVVAGTGTYDLWRASSRPVVIAVYDEGPVYE